MTGLSGLGRKVMLPDRDLAIELKFPHASRLGYVITSPINRFYNCIAWAAQDDQRWWWPDLGFQAYWPSEAPRVCTVEAFIIAYHTVGYEQCSDGEHEDGYQKITIYTVLLCIKPIEKRKILFAD